MSKYLNLDGLGTFWDKIKSTFVKKNDNGYIANNQIPVKSYRASGSRAYVRICRCKAPTSSTSPTIDCNIRMGDATVRVIIQGYNGWRANVIGYLNSTSFKFYAHQVVVEEETFYDIIAYHTTYCRGFYSPQFLYDYDVMDFSYWAAPYTEYTPTSEEEIPYIMLAKSTASSSNAPVKVNGYGDLSPITVDDTPTAGHTANLVSSDGIRDALNLKQDLLSEQTAYSAKGTATKVPQITTNSLGQVTKIEEKTISGVASADKLTTARKLAVSLSNTTTDTTFDGSEAVTNIKVSGILPVNNGGTGQNSLASVTVGKATNADITRTADATNGDKLQIGSGTSATIVNAKHAASADSATNVNLVGDVKATSTTNGDTIRVKAGSGTAAEITIINAKHAASADTATNSINSAVAADTEHKLYLIGATSPSGYQSLKTDTGIYATTESGELRATKFDVNGGCTLQYNSTTKSLDFVFG